MESISLGCLKKNIKLNPDLHISELELKPCVLGSRIREFGAWSLDLGGWRVFLLGGSKKIKLNPDLHISELEIKPCGIGSRIRDMEAESYN